ncbi:hypothetical protein MMC25_007125 [Agyrium rufum]|nr:hypothetical protein [Agyrium rufum]
MASLRTSSSRLVRQFRPTSTLQIRCLSMTEPKAQPSRLLTSEVAIPTSSRDAVASVEKKRTVRHFNTSRALKQIKDSSTVDFAYFPQYQLSFANANADDVIRVPLLPDNYTPPANHEQTLYSGPAQDVHRHEISTTSHAPESVIVSAMSEVTDNHAIELDPYELTEKVAMAAKRIVGASPAEEGALRAFWNGLLDDILGAKKMAKA